MLFVIIVFPGLLAELEPQSMKIRKEMYKILHEKDTLLEDEEVDDEVAIAELGCRALEMMSSGQFCFKGRRLAYMYIYIYICVCVCV